MSERPPFAFPAWHYTFAWTTPLLYLFGPRLLPGAAGTGAVLIFQVVILPILDALTPLPKRPSSETSASARRMHLVDAPAHHVVLLVHVALSLVAMMVSIRRTEAAFACGAGAVAQSFFSLTFVTVLLSIAAHELLHSIGEPLDRWLGVFLQGALINPTYVAGHAAHHRLVATPDDGATARRGESFYAYWVRRERMSWAASLAESRDAARRARAKGGIPFVHVCDHFALGLFISVATLVTIAVIASPRAAAFYASVCLFSATHIATGDYAQHYGMLRTRNEKTGRYEAIGPEHSWNSLQVWSQRLSFSTGGHAMHHAGGAAVPFAFAHDTDVSPALPYSILTVTGMALIPPVFFSVMNPLLDEHLRSVAERKRPEKASPTPAVDIDSAAAMRRRAATS